MEDLYSLLHVTKCIFPDEIRYSLKLLSFTVGICIVQPPNYIGLLKIEEPYRGRGFSRVLFEHVRDELIEQGVQEIKLDAAELVGKKGKLVNLYKSWGFEVCDTEDPSSYSFARKNSDGYLVTDVSMCLKLGK